MYSPLSQKTYINCVLITKGQDCSQNSLRCSSQVTILKFGSNKIFQFYLQSTDISLTWVKSRKELQNLFTLKKQFLLLRLHLEIK